ncbi:MAG: transaldolase [Deltaproteobacteria bacterium]|nr:transaldolase [Deltaproteobacteria bacterium]
MSIKIFADGANLQEMLALYRNDKRITGFTTNPTLMKKAGITNYEAFAREVLATITHLPISFEVFSDDLPEMERQALKIASWGNNVYVKIPVTNTKGISTGPVLKKLSQKNVKLNVTAVFTLEQVSEILGNLSSGVPSIISIFGGRIANAGVDPMPILAESVKVAKRNPACEILWASPREAFNVLQAEACGCHIITITPDILTTMKSFGKDLGQFSLETVQMFYRDAQSAGYTL